MHRLLHFRHHIQRIWRHSTNISFSVSCTNIAAGVGSLESFKLAMLVALVVLLLLILLLLLLLLLMLVILIVLLLILLLLLLLILMLILLLMLLNMLLLLLILVLITLGVLLLILFDREETLGNVWKAVFIFASVHQKAAEAHIFVISAFTTSLI